MASCTDTFRFNEQEMFTIIRESLPEDKNRTQNLIECKDDMIFAWNSKECCLLALNWRAAKAKGDIIKCQALIPSTPQCFTVDKILPSNDSTLIALCGARGCSVLELPRRWGPNGQYQEGKERIICRSNSLDDRLFINNAHLEVLQIRWHPASPTDSHLLVLLSDNSIRVYDETSLRHVWRVGPIPCTLPPTGINLPYLNELGETAVDFDIAPPRAVSSNNDSKNYSNTQFNRSLKNSKSYINKVEWPIVILRGDGNILIVCAGIDTEKPRVQGPLTITPGKLDNYGLDSCSLIIIPSMPPTIVIAESIGKLHHTLLIDSRSTLESSLNDTDTTIDIQSSEWTLQVLETVELELGISQNTSAPMDPCPIHLKRDFVHEFRYYAFHNTGLHAVTVDFVKKLEEFVKSESKTQSTQSPQLGDASRAEYIVCTKALNSNRVNPVLGFALLQSPAGLMLLLGSGQIVSLDVISDPSLLQEWSLKSSKGATTNAPSPVKKILNESVEVQLIKILKGGISQPLLKLDKSSEPTPQESFELLMHATQVLREQYFTKHDKARQEIQKRVKILQLLKDQQKQDIALLQKDKEQIRDKAEHLAIKYEDICDKQQILFKRAQEIVRVATLHLPKSSSAEKEFASQIEKMNLATKTLLKSLDQAKIKIHNYKIQMESWDKIVRAKKVVLPPSRENTIKEILSDLTEQIGTQIKDVKKVKSIMNI